MGPTYKIAEMLKISPIAATAYCEKVRSISGLGSALQYKTIAQQVTQHIGEAPSAQRLAEIIGVTKPIPVPMRQIKSPRVNSKKAKPKKLKRAHLSNPKRRNISRPVKSGTWFQVEDLSKSSQSANHLVRKSYFDRDRVVEERLNHCPHGVALGKLCAICDPKKFHEMTGID